MYMSLSDLRAKFMNDQPFAIQFVDDALDALKGLIGEQAAKQKLDILDNAGGKVDKDKLYGNNELLHTYVEAVKAMTESSTAKGKARLYAYLHSPWDGNEADGTPGEPEFTVDLNSRVINVPAEFLKNGVGVVGDHLAEIVFFRMQRYYDVVDLYQSSAIKIFWYNNGDKASTTYYKTTPAVIYAEGEELVLGWAISELATQTAGNIEFFIEFEHTRDDGMIDFRLDTQPAKLTIKPTINLDKDGAALDQYNDIVYSRAIYSPIINTLTASPANIIVNLPEGAVDFDPNTNNITLRVEATSPDNGKLVYHWNWNSIMVDQPQGNQINIGTLRDVTHYDLADPKAVVFSEPAQGTTTADSYDAVPNEQLAEEGVNPSANGWYVLVNEEYQLTTDTTVDENAVYYIKTPGTTTPAEDTTYQTLTTNVPGVYQGYVGNETANGGIRYVYSYVTTIEAATDINVNVTKMPGLAYLDNANSALEASADNANGVVTYKWHHIDPYTNEDEVVATNTTGIYDPSNNNTITTDPSLRGWYYVEAVNTKNNSVKIASSINKPTWIEIQPVKVARENITFTQDAGSHTRFTMTIANIPYPDATYQVYVTVDAQIVEYDAATHTTKKTTKTLPVGLPRDTFTGDTFTFDIENVKTLTPGTEYDINIYVVPVEHLGDPDYERYVEITDANGVRSRDYTRAEIKELIR